MLEFLNDSSKIKSLLEKGHLTYNRINNIKLTLKKKVYLKLLRLLRLEKNSFDLIIELKVALQKNKKDEQLKQIIAQFESIDKKVKIAMFQEYLRRTQKIWGQAFT